MADTTSNGSSNQTHLPTTTRYARVCFAIPQGGETICFSNKVLLLKLNIPITQKRRQQNALPIWEGTTQPAEQPPQPG